MFIEQTSMFADEAKSELGAKSKGGKGKTRLETKISKATIYRLALEIESWDNSAKNYD